MDEDYSSIDTTKIVDMWTIHTNKQDRERFVVEKLLEDIGVSSFRLECPDNDPPDVLLRWANQCIGIEVRGLIHQEARKRTVKSFKSPIEPRFEWPRAYSYVWDNDTFLASLSASISEKSKKIEKAKVDKKAAELCTEFWLVLHTSESYLSGIDVAELIKEWSPNPSVFSRVYIIWEYDPSRKRYPSLRLV
jgi:hypothetical protein